MREEKKMKGKQVAHSYFPSLLILPESVYTTRHTVYRGR